MLFVVVLENDIQYSVPTPTFKLFKLKLLITDIEFDLGTLDTHNGILYYTWSHVTILIF